MFYKMIENKCTQWYESERCTVKSIIEYIEKAGQMRDAQIEAIKVYLFLKIACECKPLTQLFRQGFFNSIDLNEIELSKSTREYLFQNPAAAALFEYACLTNDKDEQVSEKLEKQIKKEPTGIDYNEFFRNAFYGVSYTDYLFSLPMGAGKTYLMAAFIYLDLYFAYNEPTNPAFAHNFIIFAPSGLKSSVVPSLKTIQNFNPSWILPEPAATDIKRMISFEVLDQSKTAKKSNKIKNPNVQKIANHQPLSELFGLVAVTNAEKVILDRIQEKQGQINMFEESEDDKDRQANELRNLIGKLPSLSIFIDEVHHAVSDEIKLRAVVTRWAQNHTVNSVIGFSGTPYLDKTIDDVWRMSMLQPADKEEPVGYATQKPEALIERAIQASSDINLIVADFFGGSGTTAVCANKLGRKFIHCDIGLNSIQTTRDRLVADGAEFDVLEIKDGVQLYRNPVQTMDKIKSLIPGLKNEDSLDSFWEGAISDSKLGTIPVYVPNLMDSASKLLDKVTMNRIIHQAIPELDNDIKKVIVYYIDITDEVEIMNFIKEDDSTTVEIELRDLKSILDDVVIGDYAEFHAEEIAGRYAVAIDKFMSDRVLSKIAEFNQKAFLNSSAKKPYKQIEISEEGLELIEFLSLDCTATGGEWHSDSEIQIDKNGYVIVDGNKTKEFWDGYIRSTKKPLRLKIRNICGDETVWEV
ncbi:site-specific DNA-methyltransferase [Coprococcus comes]|uniref:site-specific DNA-methyltransferase n=1 Tax=Coprococcus comes TaxID=410072 RepID=UPI001D08285B|nr:site-specific DNA-methyltransferase [Coprococcus comes]MCB6473813.1 site-specific DNA-methyltransferase [Coprococcus comes]